MCSPSPGPRPAAGSPNSPAASVRVATGPTATSSSLAELEPLVQRRLANTAPSSAASAVLRLGHEVQLDEVRTADHLAEPDEELGLERGHGEVAAVGRPVDPVAREPAREEARQRVAAQAVRDEPVRPVRHRRRQPRATAGARPLEQRGEHGRDRSQGARGEVCGLNGRQPRRGVLQHARPSRGS